MTTHHARPQAPISKSHSNLEIPSSFRRALFITLMGLGFSNCITGCATSPFHTLLSPKHSKAEPSNTSATPQTSTTPQPQASVQPKQLPSQAQTSETTTTENHTAHQEPVSLKDPYSELEQLNRSETRNWMLTQHNATRHYLSELIETNKKKKASDTEKQIPNKDIKPSPTHNKDIQILGDKLFYIRPDSKEQTKILYVRDNTENAKEHVLFNTERIRAIPSQSIIEHFRVSPDGRWIAILTAKPDMQSLRILVVDAQTGKIMLRPIKHIEPTAFLTWRPDSQAIFYLQQPKPGNPTQVVMRLLAGSDAGKTFAVFGPNLGLDSPLQPDENMGIITSPVSPFTLAIVQSPNGIRVFSALAPQLVGNSAQPIQAEPNNEQPEMHIAWHPLIGPQDQISSFDLRGDWLYAITRRQKPNGELVRLRLSEPRWEEADLLIPANEKQELHQLTLAKDAIYVEKRQGDTSQLIKLPYNARYQNTGELQPLPDPEPDTTNKTTTTLPTPAEMATTPPVHPGDSHQKSETTPNNTDKETTEAPIKHEHHAVRPHDDADDQKHTHHHSGKKSEKSEHHSKTTEKHSSTHSNSASHHAEKESSAKHKNAHSRSVAKASQRSSKKQYRPAQPIVPTEETTTPQSHHHKNHSSTHHHSTPHKSVRSHNEDTSEQPHSRIRSRVIRLALPNASPDTQNIKLPVDGIIERLISDPMQPGVLAQINDGTHLSELVRINTQDKPELIGNTPFSQTSSTDRKQQVHSKTEPNIATNTTRLLVPESEKPEATMLPLTIISREDTDPVNSHKPVLLILDQPSEELSVPVFRPDVLFWLRQGGIIALANLFPKTPGRNDWLDSSKHVPDANYLSRLETIINYLYSKKMVTSNQFVATGEGANASLLANFLVNHPDQLTAAVLKEGVYDTLHWEIPSKHDDAMEKRLIAASSYFYIKDHTSYPSVLALGNTNRKLVIQAAKFTARLQNADKNNHAYFYSAAHPLGNETQLLFLWNQIDGKSDSTTVKN